MSATDQTSSPAPAPADSPAGAERGVSAPPPFLGSWPKVYGLLLSILTFYILVFWLITARYA